MIWLGEADLDQGRPDAAEPLLHEGAVASAPLGRRALRPRPRGARQTGLRERAQSTSSRRWRSTARPRSFHYSLAMAYRGMGDQRRAESHLRAAWRGGDSARPADEGARRPAPQRPDLRRRTPTPPATEAIGPPRRSISGRPSPWPQRASLHHKLGTALFYLGDRRGAFEAFGEALRLSPTFPAAHYALGVMHQEAGEYQKAIESFSGRARI